MNEFFKKLFFVYLFLCCVNIDNNIHFHEKKTCRFIVTEFVTLSDEFDIDNSIDLTLKWLL